MKKAILLGVFLTFSGIGAWMQYMVSNPLNSATSFMIFYDNPTEQTISRLKEVDVAIIAVHAFTREQIKEIQDAGTLIFAYTSLMQLENWNTTMTSQVKSNDFVEQDGERIYIKEWDTYLMDIRQSHYQQLLLTKIEIERREKQVDGVFFDTVDDLYYYFHDTEEHKSYLLAYETILKDVSDQGLIIFQNRGFETLQAKGEPYVSGVLWENFDSSNFEESSWARNWMLKLHRYHTSGKVRLFTEVRSDPSEQVSLNLGFPTFRKE
ncbi:endo alpha-1,4 polygalactosaminidase [Chryseomicrobium sp. FSL W7-1435]|uniref:endo alpha-1,4 polygalactosaminidase n=1 Tax=Chryseomicrobium sp. FSL W7-1435 TaxID=2921704 RepID=UPI00315B2A2B